MSNQKLKCATKGQLISNAICQAVNSSKKWTNEFIFTTMRCVFVRFLEEIEDSKEAFRNYLTFRIEIVRLIQPLSQFFATRDYQDFEKLWPYIVGTFENFLWPFSNLNLSTMVSVKVYVVAHNLNMKFPPNKFGHF